MTFRPKQELLQDDEIYRLIPILACQLGFQKFRLTGGEPILRENIIDIVRNIATINGVQEVALTTNGVRLPQLALPLTEAGLQRVNISIDSLNPQKFRQLTRWGDIDTVWRGILAAEQAGLKIKLNIVVMDGFNDREDVIELARLSYEHPWQIRFIEMMPLGQIADFQRSHLVPEEILQSRIQDALGSLQLLNDGKLDGEARLYQLDGAIGTIGFISSVSKPFCHSCNRVRLTADGRLRLCLLKADELDLLTPLRQGATDDELQNLLEVSISRKPWGHSLNEQEIPMNRVMSEIGG